MGIEGGLQDRKKKKKGEEKREKKKKRKWTGREGEERKGCARNFISHHLATLVTT